jgi:hypothetical protein
MKVGFLHTHPGMEYACHNHLDTDHEHVIVDKSVLSSK